MATVKEVQLMDGENMVTPKVWADSIYNLDESKYTTHNHDDRYYTETEINSKVNEINTSLNGKSNEGHNHNSSYYTKSEIDNKFKNYTITTALIEQNARITIPLEVGDSAYVSGSYDIPANRTFDICSNVSGGEFFIARFEAGETQCYIRHDVGGLYIARIQNDHSTSWGDTAKIYIRRLK